MRQLTLSNEINETVAKWLKTSRERGQRIRIFYGDSETGRDWMEEYFTMGVVGGTTGTCSPILVHNSRSMGGCLILEKNIVRITVDKKDVYRHPNYHIGHLEIRESIGTTKEAGYTHSIYRDGQNMAAFKSEEKAQKYLSFIKGDSNRK